MQHKFNVKEDEIMNIKHKELNKQKVKCIVFNSL